VDLSVPKAYILSPFFQFSTNRLCQRRMEVPKSSDLCYCIGSMKIRYFYTSAFNCQYETQIEFLKAAASDSREGLFLSKVF